MADVAEEYRSSLSELNFNSKPHINMLTMLAEENLQHAPIIVQTIVDHINSVTPDIKLPSLYLVDSIVKNIGQIYSSLFSKHLVELFTSVFEKVDETIRSLLYKLRSTWTGIFPSAVLLDLDKSIICLDPAWPVSQLHKNIHVNPKFLDKPCVDLPKQNEALTKSQCALLEVQMKKKQLVLAKALEEKKKKLMELQIKAALAAAVESSKEDVQKKVNARDPRLAKKVPAAAAGTDSTTLQSVVVIPKGNIRRKNEKDSLSPVSKKIKLDGKDSKKDVRNKHAELGVNSKVNVDHHVLNQQSNSLFTGNIQKDTKCKKQLEYEASGHCHSDRLPKYPVELKIGSDGISQNKINMTLNQSNQSVIPGSHCHSVFKEGNKSEEKKYHYNHQPTIIANEVFDKNTRKLEPPPLPPLFWGNEDKDYRILPKNLDERNMNDATYRKRMSVPVVKSFKLDNKERKVYFVNERSFAFLDDNVPRELTFEGSVQLVFIEGLPQPIELGFGGHEIKFEMDGKFHFIRFGTPAREIYIDDYPYEASFDGIPFTAVLENGKSYRIKISGPSPKVVLSTVPACELYERFCQNNREFLQRFDNEPNINCDFSNDNIHVANRDVDMRVNNGKFYSAFFNFPLEKMNDVNWQRIHVGNSQQTEWNVPKNSFETYKDINPNFMMHRNYTQGPDWDRSLPLTEVQNSALNMPPPLPPKQLINRCPSIPASSTFGSTYGSINTPLQQFSSEYPRCVHPNNGPFSHPESSRSDFSVGPTFNEAPTIPKLSPPPLPPFLGAIPSTSCMTALSVTKDLVQTSVPYCSSTESVTLPQIAANVTLMTTPVLVTNTVISTQMLSSTVPLQVTNSTTSIQATPPTSLNTGPVNMNLILEKLVAAGVIGKSSGNAMSSSPSATSSESEKNESEKKEESSKEDSIPEIVFESKCLKEYYPGVINALHSGSQCGICGMRFKEIQREQYSHHLDWHFRRIRREKNGAKKPFSRRLFYEINDWIQFKEFEDVDERAPSYFELQAIYNGDQAGDSSPEIVCSVPCSDCESEKCAVCGEQFQLFWVEEEEEWHLKNAVIHDDQVYHPTCYEDCEKANNSVIMDHESSFDESKMDMETGVEELDEQQHFPLKIKEEMCDDEEKEKKCVDDNNEGKIEDHGKEEKDESRVKEEENFNNENKVLEVEVKKEIIIKVEPVDSEEVEKNNSVVDDKYETDSIESVNSKTEDMNHVIKIEPILEPILKSENIDGESISTSQNENVPTEDGEIEFRPPTPDPQFQVLPPVSKGTEVSNLCTIM